MIKLNNLKSKSQPQWSLCCSNFVLEEHGLFFWRRKNISCTFPKNKVQSSGHFIWKSRKRNEQKIDFSPISRIFFVSDGYNSEESKKLGAMCQLTIIMYLQDLKKFILVNETR